MITMTTNTTTKRLASAHVTAVNGATTQATPCEGVAKATTSAQLFAQADELTKELHELMEAAYKEWGEDEDEDPEGIELYSDLNLRDAYNAWECKTQAETVYGTVGLTFEESDRAEEQARDAIAYRLGNWGNGATYALPDSDELIELGIDILFAICQAVKAEREEAIVAATKEIDELDGKLDELLKDLPDYVCVPSGTESVRSHLRYYDPYVKLNDETWDELARRTPIEVFFVDLDGTDFDHEAFYGTLFRIGELLEELDELEGKDEEEDED